MGLPPATDDAGPEINATGLPALAAIARSSPEYSHDAVSRQLMLAPRAALRVLMRLTREERHARLRTTTIRPTFPLLPSHAATAQLWRADLVDEITLSGALPTGWKAELWNEDASLP